MTKKWRLTYDTSGRKSARVNLIDAGDLDELVIMARDGKTALVHLEKMDTHHWWMQVGDASINVHDGKSGVSVNVERGEYGEANGNTGFTDEALGLMQCEHRAGKKR
jgi:hypothetical protein